MMDRATARPVFVVFLLSRVLFFFFLYLHFTSLCEERTTKAGHEHCRNRRTRRGEEEGTDEGRAARVGGDTPTSG